MPFIYDWNPLGLESHLLNVLLTTLPDANRSVEDNEIFTLHNALCCLRREHGDKFNQHRCIDLEHALDALQKYNSKFVNEWNAAGPTSDHQMNAYTFFRAVYAEVQEDLGDRLKHLEVVTTDEDLRDHDGFPIDSLEYLCTGIKMGMHEADLAKVLEKWYPQMSPDEPNKPHPDRPNKLRPFTEANVRRIFDYLRAAGWGTYDEFMLAKGDPYDVIREDKMSELKAEAEEA
ncbi:MAG: hypothetical protein Q9199_003299 [Rusavskia elegans]